MYTSLKFRQMILQRIAVTLYLRIGSIFTREEIGGFIAVINMTVPNHSPLMIPIQLPFEGEHVPNPYTTVESASEAAIKYMRTYKYIQIDDENHETVLQLTKKLAVTELFQMLYQQAAWAAFASAAKEKQDHEALLSHYNTLQQSFAALQQHCSLLFQQNVALQRDKDSYLQQRNILHEHHEALQHEHQSLASRYIYLQGRYNHAINKIRRLRLMSAGYLPINHVNSIDKRGNHYVMPHYVGPSPPIQRKHKLAYSLTKVSEHCRVTEAFLLQHL